MTERTSGTESAEALTGPVLRQIGHHLRLAREERGESLQDIAQFLRIRRVYLQALEEGDLSGIPGRAYALGFLRSYGDYLGFDGERIVEEVKRTDEPLPESPTLQVREPLPESHRPPLVAVGVSIALAALVYIGWNYWQDRQQEPVVAALDADDRPASATADAAELSDDDREGETAARTDREVAVDELASGADASDDGMPPLPAIPEPPMPERVDALTEVSEAVDDDGPSADEVVTAILEQPEESGEEAGSTEAEPTSEAAAPDLMAVITAQSGRDELRTFGDEEATGRIVLVASEPSWVQVRSPSRDYVWTRTLEPGDAYFVPDRDDLALWTGNAGGLKVVVDGRPLADLGNSGQVRRDIPLAAETLSERYPPN